MNTVKVFAALLLALGVLTTASAALAERTEGDEVQAPRTHGTEDIQAP